MANPSPSPQNLKEFAQSLLDDLRDGRISPDEAIIASLQYPYLREFIHARRDEVADALQDEEKLKAVLDGALTAAAATINRELPQFQVEKPDAQLSPSDVVSRARSFRAARLEVVAATRRQQASVGQLRKTFINRLVGQWIDQTRPLMENEKQKMAAGALKTELEERLEDVSSFEEISTRVQHSLKNTLVTAGDAATIQGEVAPAQRELITATQKLAGLTAIPKELVLRASTPRPDWFTAIAIQTISSAALPPAAAFARAASLTRAAEAISTPLVKEKDITATGVFFRALGVTPTQKAFAAAADALFNQLSPFARQEVIKATFSHALEGVLAKTDVLTKALGQGFVESEIFGLAIDSARKEFARDAGAGAGARQARGALDDVIGSLLRGPLVAPLVGNPKEMILSYLELLAVEAKLPHDKKMLFLDQSPAVSVGAGHSSSFALRAAASQRMQMLPSWQVFYVMLLASSPSIISVYQGGRPSSFSSTGSAPMGPIGGGLNAALGWAGRGLSGVAFGLGGGLISGVFGGGLGSLFNKLRGPREPDRFFDDTPKLLAIIIVVIIVVLFVFPSFINSTLTSRMTKYAALLGGAYDEPDRFIEDPIIYPPPDYLDIEALKSKLFPCLSYGAGVSTQHGASRALNGSEKAIIENTVENNPAIKALSCALDCSSRNVNISVFPNSGTYVGYAPSSLAGNIIFYPRMFSGFSEQSRARLLAHELAHNIDWFGGGLAEGYYPLSCGPTGKYPWKETPEEAFATAVELYVIGNPFIRDFCGGKAYEYFGKTVAQCR